MLSTLRELYGGQSALARRFHLGLLIFDITTVAFIVATSFMGPAPWLRLVNAAFGFLITADLVARILASRRRAREVVSLSTLADVVAIGSFLAPITGGAGSFLRVLRTLRLVRTLGAMDQTRGPGGGRPSAFHRNDEALVAVANLLVFVFIMTGLVYETQHRANPDIGNYADALYFTVTALTTTGFGDITLPGTTGRMLTVIVMIAGVTLFLRLAQVMFRPYKVRFPCPACGLQRHEHDAVHCKACGLLLNIPDDGDAG